MTFNSRFKGPGCKEMLTCGSKAGSASSDLSRMAFICYTYVICPIIPGVKDDWPVPMYTRVSVHPTFLCFVLISESLTIKRVLATWLPYTAASVQLWNTHVGLHLQPHLYPGLIGIIFGRSDETRRRYKSTHV